MIRITEIPTLLLTWAVYAICYPAMVVHTWIFGRRAPEVQPAPEMPYIAQPVVDALAEAKRIEAALVEEYKREKAQRDEYLRVAFAARRDAKVKAEIDRLVREVEHG